MKIVRKNNRHCDRRWRNTLHALMLALFAVATVGTIHAQTTDCNIVQNSSLSVTGPNCGSSNLCAGWVAPWIPTSNTPQYVNALMLPGCGDAGYLQMWGHRTAHEAVSQPLGTAMNLGVWYKLRLISRRFQAPINNPNHQSITRVLAHNGGYPNPVFPTPASVVYQTVGEATDFTPACSPHGDNDLPIIQAANNWGRISVDVGNLMPGLGPNDVSWAQVDLVTIRPVCCLLDVRAIPVVGNGDCCYNIQLTNNVDNISVFGVRATVATPGYTIASASPPPGRNQFPLNPAGGTVVTWSNVAPMAMGTHTGTLCLNNSSTSTSAIVVFEWLDRQGRVICTQRIVVKCPPPCIIVSDPTIECIGDSLGFKRYQACVLVQNNCNAPGLLTVTPIGSNNVSISSVSTAVIPGGIATMVCVTFVDVPAPGTNVCLKFSANYGPNGCPNKCEGAADSICIPLPKCPCLTVTHPSLKCIAQDANGNPIYQLMMNVATGPAGTLQIIPNSGTVSGVTPAAVPASFSGLVTATWVNTGNVSLVCFRVRLLGPNGQVLCETTVCLDVPPCPAPCPCPFKIELGQSTVIPFGAGFVFVNQPITVGGGVLPIMRVRATVVSVSITQFCQGAVSNPPASATFVVGSLPPYVTTGINTSELTWTNMSCPTLNNSSMAMILRILPPPPPGCTQSVRFCIRYTITDCKCRTCDTLVCYGFQRGSTPFAIEGEGKAATDPGVTGTDQKTSDGPAPGATAQKTPFASLAMLSSTDGILTIDNPNGDETTDPVTLHAITFRPPPGVEILSMQPLDESWNAGAYTDSGMTATGTLHPGRRLSFAVKFDNDIGYTKWTNGLHMAYSVPGLPPSILLNGDVQVPADAPAVANVDLGRNDVMASGATISLADAVPNPLERTTTIGFTTAEFEPSVQLTLTDPSGKVVGTFIEGKAYEAGDHTITIDCSELPPGTYYYTLRANDESQTRKMVIVR